MYGLFLPCRNTNKLFPDDVSPGDTSKLRKCSEAIRKLGFVAVGNPGISSIKLPQNTSTNKLFPDDVSPGDTSKLRKCREAIRKLGFIAVGNLGIKAQYYGHKILYDFAFFTMLISDDRLI